MTVVSPHFSSLLHLLPSLPPSNQSSQNGEKEFVAAAAAAPPVALFLHNVACLCSDTPTERVEAVYH